MSPKFGLFLVSIFLFWQLPSATFAQSQSQNPEGLDFSDLNSNLNSIDLDSPPFEFLRSNTWRRLLWHRNSESGFDKNRHVTTTQLIEQAGFQSETREVVTEDGYILTLDRIGSKFGHKTDQNSNSTEKRPAVLMFSGLLACGDTWLIQSPEKSLAFILANLNYDVWLANPRGCYYSRKHKWKNPNSVDYWDFSWHEIGVYDLSSMIDFILKETGHSKLNYIGLSMGTTTNFVLLSERPEYNDKLNMSINFGCSAFFKHAISPSLRMGARASQLPLRLLSQVATGGSQELMPKTALLHEVTPPLCANNMEPICTAAIFSVMGFDPCQHNSSLVPLALELYPSGSSLKMGLHYLQSVRSGHFRQYDHGRVQNLRKYRSIEPPKYNLANIKSRQFLFHSKNDWLSHPKFCDRHDLDFLVSASFFKNRQEDVKKLASGFSPLAKTELCRVKWRYFNHLDYLLAKDVNLLVNDRVIRILEGKSCWANDEGKDDGKDEPSIKCPNQAESVRAQAGMVQRVIGNLNRALSNFLQTRIGRRAKISEL